MKKPENYASLWIGVRVRFRTLHEGKDLVSIPHSDPASAAPRRIARMAASLVWLVWLLVVAWVGDTWFVVKIR